MLYTTPPLNIIDLPADAAHAGPARRLDQILGIVLHSTEGTDSRAWLSTTSSPPASTTKSCPRRASPTTPAAASGGTTRSTT